MRKYFLILLTSWLSFSSISQIALQDAIVLQEHSSVENAILYLRFTPENFGQVSSILYHYLDEESKKVVEGLRGELKVQTDILADTARASDWSEANNLKEEIILEIHDLIKDSFTGSGFVSIKGAPHSGGIKEIFTKGISGGLDAVGGLDVTSIADGLARFIVGRAKQELNAYFFDEFRKNVKKHVELRTLFPSTSNLLLVVGSEIYNYNAYLTGLREAFEMDMSNLLENVPDLLDNQKYAKYFEENPQLKDFRLVLKSAFYVIGELKTQKHPGEIIHNYPQAHGVDKLPDNMYNAIMVGDLFSQSLRSKTEGQYWASANTLSMLSDPTVFRLYMGLVSKRISPDLEFNSKEGTTINFRTEFAKIGPAWNATATNIEAYKGFVMKMTEEIQQVVSAMDAIRNVPENQKKSAKQIINFVDATVDLLDQVQQLNTLPILKDSIPELDLKVLGTFTRVARSAGGLYANITEERYSAGIINLMDIIDATCGEVVNEFVKKNIGYVEQLAAKAEGGGGVSGKHGTKSAKQKKELQDGIGDDLKFRDKVLKYGNLMASIAAAESSEEVEAILKATALPPGSYRVKRQSKSNISLNSYLGAFVGHEEIKGVSNKGVNNFSLSAPVGISFSKGGLGRKTDGWAIGGFISLIDVGAVASFRFGDDSTSQVSTIQLKQIIAPGAFLTFNPRKSPFTISLGAQYGPLLREVTATENSALANSYIRYGGSIALDIPLFNLFNRKD